MKKFLKITVVVVLVFVVGIYGYLVYSTDKNHAPASEKALASLAPGDNLDIEVGDWLVMKPANQTPTTGVIVYPGAYCDIRGYAPVFREIAKAGYLLVGITMPFDFAIFAPDAADEVRAAYPDIERWVLIGHSMGGAMAGRYAFNHLDDLSGVVFWDSYPPEANSLAGTSIPALHVHRALPDGTPSEKFTSMKHVYPDDTVWVPVPGGNHMNFGSFSYGSYIEEWDATLDEDSQHEIIATATVEAIKRMTKQ